MKRSKPSSVAILAARIQRGYPSLSPYSSASLATELCAIERAQRRHAERCCSGEDGGYVKREKQMVAPNRQGWVVVHDPAAEERADDRIGRRLFRWRSQLGELLNPCNPGETCVRTDLSFERQGDPRGAVLLVRFPNEPEAVSV